MPKTLPNEQILNFRMSKAYTEYCKKMGVSKENKVKGRKELFTIVRAILRIIARNIVDKRGGVMIKGFGYFFNWKIPRKMTYQIKTRGGTRVEKFNHHSDHHMYSTIFFPAAGVNGTRGWSMDNKIHSRIKQGVNKKIFAGFKYRIYPYSLKKLLNY